MQTILLTICACYLLTGAYVMLAFLVDYAADKKTGRIGFETWSGFTLAAMATVATWPTAVWFVFVTCPAEERRSRQVSQSWNLPPENAER